MYMFDTLGGSCRLGNQLFQYAALFGVGRKRHGEIAIPARSQDLSGAFSRLSAHLLDSFSPQYRYEEPTYAFHPGLWDMPDGTSFSGYFQSPRYFTHCEPELRQELVFQDRIEREASEFIQSLGPGPFCAVHIRRGDYLYAPNYHHHLTFANYYAGALEFMRTRAAGSRFLVFSDDTAYCRDTLPSEFLISQGHSGPVDLCIMSKCAYHIIANSSFSWWGAWLSDSATVVAPKTWLGPDGPQDWHTIYCPHWVTL